MRTRVVPVLVLSKYILASIQEFFDYPKNQKIGVLVYSQLRFIDPPKKYYNIIFIENYCIFRGI
jgi:hypothetical protein